LKARPLDARQIDGNAIVVPARFSTVTWFSTVTFATERIGAIFRPD
jgi:hypothetical protein